MIQVLPAKRRPITVVKRSGIAVGSILLSGILIVLAGLPVYVFPNSDAAQESDVIYVIGPPNPTRREIAERLLDEGLSDVLLLSVPSTGPQSADELAECSGDSSYTVVCATPDLFTTQGEAQYLAKQAKLHGWDSATVITFRPHVSRTRLLMERCFDGDVMVVADPVGLTLRQWAHQYLYQSGAFVKALFTPEC